MEPSTLRKAESHLEPKHQTDHAHIVEIFSSIQGEGPYVGRRHIFVRFFACNLRCNYCDTPESLTGNPDARLEQTAGAGDFMVHRNPLSLCDVVACINMLSQTPHHAVSLTGGEPLLQADFINLLAPHIRNLGQKAYLETNGTLPDKLRQAAPSIDIVAMDIKLPETLKGGRDWFPEHSEFLEVCLERDLEVFCKLVLPSDPDWQQIEHAAQMVADVSQNTPFILQPVTPFGDVTKSPTQPDILRAYETASAILSDVRVIPQTHKMVNLR